MTWKPSYLTHEQLEERRLQGGRLLKAGRVSQADIARHLGVSRATVSDWTRRVEAGGLRGLRQRKAPGATSKLRAEQEQKLKRFLNRGALRSGFDTDRWTLSRVAELIEREFGVRYHPNCLKHLLNRPGYRPQKPLPRAAEREREPVQAWLEHDLPRIPIKKSRRRCAEIVFWDEFGFSFQEAPATTWARRGRRPILRQVNAGRRAISTAVAFTFSGKIYKQHFEGAIHSEQVIEALEHFQQHHAGPIILIWDRSRMHTSRKTQAYLLQHPAIHGVIARLLIRTERRRILSWQRQTTLAQCPAQQ